MLSVSLEEQNHQKNRWHPCSPPGPDPNSQEQQNQNQRVIEAGFQLEPPATPAITQLHAVNHDSNEPEGSLGPQNLISWRMNYVYNIHGNPMDRANTRAIVI